MKKLLNITIIILFCIQVIIKIIVYQMNLTFIDSLFGSYIVIFSVVLTFAFVKVLWKMDYKYQNYVLFILPITYFLSLSINIAVVIGLISVKAINRYERTILNKGLRLLYILLIPVVIVHLVVFPAIFSGHQDLILNKYKIYESPDKTYTLETRNFGTVDYGGIENIELSFNENVFFVMKHEIAYYEINRSNVLTVKWIDNYNVQVNGSEYKIEGKTVIKKEP